MSSDTVIVECATCPVRERQCDDCMVTALFAPTSAHLPLDDAEHAAVRRLVAAGLVDAESASRLQARREPWAARAVG